MKRISRDMLFSCRVSFACRGSKIAEFLATLSELGDFITKTPPPNFKNFLFFCHKIHQTVDSLVYFVIHCTHQNLFIKTCEEIEMPKKKKAVPQILPREPLTKKARAAISTYATIVAEKKGHYHFVMVDAVLKAERMRRSDLYAWLEQRGYRWLSQYGFWEEKPSNGKAK